MPRRRIVSSLAFLASLVVFSPPLLASPYNYHVFPHTTYPFPNWELTIEGLYVQRKGVRKASLIRGKARPPDPALGCLLCPSRLTTNMVVNDMDWEPGVRGILRYMPSSRRTVEFALTWVDKFEGEKGRRSSKQRLSYLFNRDYTVDYIDAKKVEAEYTSQFLDGEANYWGHMTPRNVNYFSVSGVIGLRGMYLGEHFSLDYTNTLQYLNGAVTPVNGVQDKSTYWSRTRNYILGPQVGGSIQWNPTYHWSWEIQAKTGIMADAAWKRLRLGDRNNTVVLKNFKNHKVFSTTFLEGGFFLFYRFRNYFSTHVGYRLLGLWGLALAPMQLTGQSGPSDGRKVDKTGKIYLHFVSLGLNFDF